MRFRYAPCLMILIAGACLAFAAPAIAQHEHAAGNLEKLGKVDFSVSCDATIQPQFNRAVAILHSFWYDKAEDAFTAIAAADPNCAMAHWGVAMSLYHQLWEPPVEAGGLPGRSRTPFPRAHRDSLLLWRWAIMRPTVAF